MFEYFNHLFDTDHQVPEWLVDIHLARPFSDQGKTIFLAIQKSPMLQGEKMIQQKTNGCELRTTAEDERILTSFNDP